MKQKHPFKTLNMELENTGAKKTSLWWWQWQGQVPGASVAVVLEAGSRGQGFQLQAAVVGPPQTHLQPAVVGATPLPFNRLIFLLRSTRENFFCLPLRALTDAALRKWH